MPRFSKAEIYETAILEVKNGSSPYVSSVRPQRTSRAMLTTGDNTCRMPLDFTSTAIADATVFINFVSHEAARPIACGKTVAPSLINP